MMGIGWMEIGVVLLILFLLFGARRLPELGEGVGKAIRQFKDSLSGKDRDS